MYPDLVHLEELKTTTSERLEERLAMGGDGLGGVGGNSLHGRSSWSLEERNDIFFGIFLSG